MRRIPLLALRNESQSSSRELPSGVRQPKPLTTIRSRRALRVRLKGTQKSYTAGCKVSGICADKTIGDQYGHCSGEPDENSRYAARQPRTSSTAANPPKARKDQANAGLYTRWSRRAGPGLDSRHRRLSLKGNSHKKAQKDHLIVEDSCAFLRPFLF